MATKKKTEVEEVMEEVAEEVVDRRPGAVEFFGDGKFECEYEEVFLPKARGGNGKESQDVWVSVNGAVWYIQRGKKVKVPYFVADALGNSAQADETIQEYLDSLTKV